MEHLKSGIIHACGQRQSRLPPHNPLELLLVSSVGHFLATAITSPWLSPGLHFPVWASCLCPSVNVLCDPGSCADGSQQHSRGPLPTCILNPLSRPNSDNGGINWSLLLSVAPPPFHSYLALSSPSIPC